MYYIVQDIIITTRKGIVKIKCVYKLDDYKFHIIATKNKSGIALLSFPSKRMASGEEITSGIPIFISNYIKSFLPLNFYGFCGIENSQN